MFGVSEALVLIGLLSAGVVYGTDAFFAVVGRPALAKANDASIVDVMGHMHLYADARLPIFGVAGLGSTIALVFTTGLGSAASVYSGLAVIGLGLQLGAYLTVARPINMALTAAAEQKVTLADARSLQRRWNSVIILRALGCALGVSGIALASMSLS